MLFVLLFVAVGLIGMMRVGVHVLVLLLLLSVHIIPVSMIDYLSCC